MESWDALLWIFFALELYHSITHWVVLAGWKLLPRKDLVKVRYYFLIDMVCASIAYSLHGAYPLVIIIAQQLEHLFYFSFWETSWAAKRVISWSSLDWKKGRWNQLDLVLGTFFDFFVHVLNTYYIGLLISPMSVATASLSTFIIYFAVMHNPKTAWSSPSQTPEWVAKRIKPLTPEQEQNIEIFNKLQFGSPDL